MTIRLPSNSSATLTERRSPSTRPRAGRRRPRRARAAAPCPCAVVDGVLRAPLPVGEGGRARRPDRRAGRAIPPSRRVARRHRAASTAILVLAAGAACPSPRARRGAPPRRRGSAVASPRGRRRWSSGAARWSASRAARPGRAARTRGPVGGGLLGDLRERDDARVGELGASGIGSAPAAASSSHGSGPPMAATHASLMRTMPAWGRWVASSASRGPKIRTSSASPGEAMSVWASSLARCSTQSPAAVARGSPVLPGEPGAAQDEDELLLAPMAMDGRGAGARLDLAADEPRRRLPAAVARSRQRPAHRATRALPRPRPRPTVRPEPRIHRCHARAGWAQVPRAAADSTLECRSKSVPRTPTCRRCSGSPRPSAARPCRRRSTRSRARYRGAALGYGTVVVSLVRPALGRPRGRRRLRRAGGPRPLLGRTSTRASWDARLDERSARRGAHHLRQGEVVPGKHDASRWMPSAPAAGPEEETRGHPQDALIAPSARRARASARRPVGRRADVGAAADRPRARRPRVRGGSPRRRGSRRRAEFAGKLRHGTGVMLSVSAQLHAGRSTQEVLDAVCGGINQALSFPTSPRCWRATTATPAPRPAWASRERDRSRPPTRSTPSRRCSPEHQQLGCVLLDEATANAIVPPEVPRAHRSTHNGIGPRAWRNHWLMSRYHRRGRRAARLHLGRRPGGPPAAAQAPAAGAAAVRRPRLGRPGDAASGSSACGSWPSATR